MGVVVGLMLGVALVTALVPGASGAMVAWCALGVLSWARPGAVDGSAWWVASMLAACSVVAQGAAPVIAARACVRRPSQARGALVGALLGAPVAAPLGSLAGGVLGWAAGLVVSGPWRARLAAPLVGAPVVLVAVVVDMVAVVGVAGVIAVCDAGPWLSAGPR